MSALQPMPDRNYVIEVSQVANGFIVRPTRGWFTHDQDQHMWPGAATDYRVFRTMAELTTFLAEHFDWRARNIAPDAEQTIGANIVPT